MKVDVFNLIKYYVSRTTSGLWHWRASLGVQHIFPNESIDLSKVK